MFLNKISLLHFKNHENLSLSFTKKLNCIIGNNGVGKTNLLDAIYYLCLTKSYFNPADQQNIQFGKDFFRLEGEFKRQNENFHIVYKLPTNKRKELFVNDLLTPKLSDHVGKFPVIIISPDDGQLITGSSEERRKFIDNTISQVNHEYLDRLILYNKILAQRNAALKKFAETKKVDKALIETYNQQLIPLGTKIYEARKIVTGKLSPIFQSYYKQLSLEREAVSFTYYSQLNEKPFDLLLKDNFERDLILQRTDGGIHKDDLEFFLTPGPSPSSSASGIFSEGEEKRKNISLERGEVVKIKKFGSQGQQKSFIISIKFAQFSFIKVNKIFNPLLLIDDIFDKLDNDRSKKLVELIANGDFGQVFITDTDSAHINDVMKGREDLFSTIHIK